MIDSIDFDNVSFTYPGRQQPSLHKVSFTLHAGEIAKGLVKPEDLSFHIRASVERGHAERIGQLTRPSRYTKHTRKV